MMSLLQTDSMRRLLVEAAPIRLEVVAWFLNDMDKRSILEHGIVCENGVEQSLTESPEFFPHLIEQDMFWTSISHAN